MTRRLVSIVVPVYNRAGPLREAVASALAQTYRPIEILIVDDGSTDDTPEVAARLAAEHPDARVIRRENGGPGAARETGRQAARGEFLQYLDSDDLFLPRKLELQVAVLEERPHCVAAYGICTETEADGSLRAAPLRPSDRPIPAMFPTFLATRWWNTVTPLYRRSISDAVGGWSQLRLEEDWEYDARIAALRTPVAFVHDKVAVHRDLGDARLSRGCALDPERLRDRATAHLSILESALRAGIAPEVAERVHFARELFFLCRQCGRASLTPESRWLFEAARRASTEERSRSLEFRLYLSLAALCGWRNAAVVTELLRRAVFPWPKRASLSRRDRCCRAA